MKKTVYITGGSSGIGLGLAHFYTKKGDDVVLIARDQDKLDVAVKSCESQSVVASQVIAGESLDVTAYQSLPAAMEKVVARYGLPDLLILCAGVAGNKTLLDTPAEEFDSIVNINLGGSREMARAVLPGMLQRGSGQLAFVSSMAGLIGLYGYGAYSASKFAVTGMVQALRQELAGSGVSVHLVCPPEVNTPMIAAENEVSVPQTRFLKDLIGTMEPEVAAEKIAQGIHKHKAVIIPGVRANVMVWMSRCFPELFARSSELLLRWRFS
ncbi:MAG: SDR family NAD(P)-dependent oxidoreductase [Halioglobus sp.]